MTDAQYFEGKRLGYPDAALRRISGRQTLPKAEIAYRMVDTCAAEFDAETPYFYSAFEPPAGTEDGAPTWVRQPELHCESRNHPRSGKPVMLVLGSGPIRIGQGRSEEHTSELQSRI